MSLKIYNISPSYEHPLIKLGQGGSRAKSIFYLITTNYLLKWNLLKKRDFLTLIPLNPS